MGLQLVRDVSPRRMAYGASRGITRVNSIRAANARAAAPDRPTLYDAALTKERRTANLVILAASVSRLIWLWRTARTFNCCAAGLLGLPATVPAWRLEYNISSVLPVALRAWQSNGFSRAVYSFASCLHRRRYAFSPLCRYVFSLSLAPVYVTNGLYCCAGRRHVVLLDTLLLGSVAFQVLLPPSLPPAYYAQRFSSHRFLSVTATADGLSQNRRIQAGSR